MKETAKTGSAGQATTRIARKPYKAPELRVFGKLHLLTQGSAGSRTDGGGTRRMAMSDRRCKQRIVRVGVHPLGIGLYLFDYKPEFHASWGRGRQFGVMADEVESILPQAVSVHPDGYKRVNYAMLGIGLARP
jgi:Chaperone of endosialidase